jgi:hypothetical protein
MTAPKRTTRPSRTTKTPTRISDKPMEKVRFALEGFDGEFTAPSLKRATGSVLNALDQGNLIPATEFIREHAPETAELFENYLEGEEIGDFLNTWFKASGIDLSKSRGVPPTA